MSERKECESFGIKQCGRCKLFAQQTKQWGTCFARPVPVNVFMRAWQNIENGATCPTFSPGRRHDATQPLWWEVWLTYEGAGRALLDHKGVTHWRLDTALRYAQDVAKAWAVDKGVKLIELVPDADFDMAETVRLVVWRPDWVAETKKIPL